jgi:hypothetical protein
LLIVASYQAFCILGFRNVCLNCERADTFGFSITNSSVRRSLVGHIINDNICAQLAKHSTAARPIPREPPVTSATLSFSFKLSVSNFEVSKLFWN